MLRHNELQVALCIAFKSSSLLLKLSHCRSLYWDPSARCQAARILSTSETTFQFKIMISPDSRQTCSRRFRVKFSMMIRPDRDPGNLHLAHSIRTDLELHRFQREFQTLVHQTWSSWRTHTKYQPFGCSGAGDRQVGVFILFYSRGRYFT